MRDRALALRMANDLSIRAIAERLAVPRATVGDWLKGAGETVHFTRCELCRDVVLTSRAHARACCPAHAKILYTLK